MTSTGYTLDQQQLCLYITAKNNFSMSKIKLYFILPPETGLLHSIRVKIHHTEFVSIYRIPLDLKNNLQYICNVWRHMISSEGQMFFNIYDGLGPGDTFFPVKSSSGSR